MRYAVFTDVHANLEALEAVLAEIDTLAEEEPIDQIWFLGDLVGYGPNPNECITLLRKRTDVIIAGNHDAAAVGNLDLEEFSTAARISAEWTAQQLTEEHRAFLTNLPERMEIGDCTLVHGSPYGPLWEYLTSEAMAERSFQHFSSRLCFVGHTHVPVIFQQPDSIANAPTLPLEGTERHGSLHAPTDAATPEAPDEMANVADMATVASLLHPAKAAIQAESAYADPSTGRTMSEDDANAVLEQHDADTHAETHVDTHPVVEPLVAESIVVEDDTEPFDEDMATQELSGATVENAENAEDEAPLEDDPEATVSLETALSEVDNENNSDDPDKWDDESVQQENTFVFFDESTTNGEGETPITEESLNSEIEELLELLIRTENMIQVTNEMLVPPEGHWELPEDYRAIINPGGVGQPRDNDARAAFMIYDTERGFINHK